MFYEMHVWSLKRYVREGYELAILYVTSFLKDQCLLG